MKYISWLGRTSSSIYVPGTVLVVIIIFCFTAQVKGEYVVTNECVDVALVFARGSGQNNTHQGLIDPLDEDFFEFEKESYTFFKKHAEHFDDRYPNLTYKAVSIHDFPGKYDPVGYQAAGVGWESITKIKNSANADASWVPGNYQDSVKHGIAETVGYLKDQIAHCPSQYFIVGGYSQGAQVMGESLFQLTAEERAKILGVGFFGDPKYIGSTGAWLPVIDLSSREAVSFPWRRGEATNRDTGMLEARFPYVPEGMERRTLSWCSKHDIVCAGWSALRLNSAHGSYSGGPIPYAVRELVNIAAPQLLALNSSDGEVPPVEVSQEDRDRIRDVLFLVNDDSNDSALRTFKYDLDPMLYDFGLGFNLTRYAAKSFGEHDYGFSTPRVDNIQAFLPYQDFDPSNPVFTKGNLGKAFIQKYGNTPYIIGGGDLADPYQLAIERSIVYPGWSDDPEVEKNIIMIVDRPPKDPYTYNICNSTVRQWMHYPDIDGYKNCYAEFHREVWDKIRVPEACETVLMVLTQDECMNPLMSPSVSQLNTRTMQDSLKLAQANNIKISIVIPFSMENNPGNNLSKESVRNQLRDFAQATGGIFIYYKDSPKYNSTLLHDTLFRVFTKKPGSLHAVTNGESNKKVLNLHTNTPVILDVSRSDIVANSYKWDFDDDGTWDETTEGPVTETSFDTPTTGFFRVQALDTNGAVLGETRQVYQVSENTDQEPITPPQLPANITATEQADGTIILTWYAVGEGDLVVFDPKTKLPITSASVSEEGTTIVGPYDSLLVRIISEDIVSEPLTINVVSYVPLTQNNVGENQDTSESPAASIQLQPAVNTSVQNSSPTPLVTFADTVAQAAPEAITPIAETSQVAGISTNVDIQDSPGKRTTNYNLLFALLAIIVLILFITQRRKVRA